MKLLLLAFLMVFTSFAGKVSEPVKAFDDFYFELSVNSTTDKTARFNLLITGITINEIGEQKTFRMQRDDLKTPYKLDLDKGKYKAVIETKEGNVLSKVQGFKNGEKKGFANGNQRVATMHFEYSGE